MMRSSFPTGDVLVLLTDITGMVCALDTPERERLIQAGVHYSEMLPVEYTPTEEYMRVFNEVLAESARATARAVALACEQIWKKRRGNVALVSLARAGTPVGVLMRRYLRRKYQIEPPHYTISIIRGRGIDHNAMRYILERHNPQDLQFVDGWTGKGAIITELAGALEDYPQVPVSLAVLSDPAGVADIYGTREDMLIASSCLNCTVSGLLSRTFLNSDYIGSDDFHGAVYYEELSAADRTMDFINTIESRMEYNLLAGQDVMPPDFAGLKEAREVAKQFSVRDINFVKPGLGETIRVLLRRVPWKVLVRDPGDVDNICHILRLAGEKGIPVETYPLKSYRACGIIRDLSADL